MTLVGGGGIPAQCPGKLGVQMAEGVGSECLCFLENAGFLCPPFAPTPVLTASLGFIQAQLKTPLRLHLQKLIILRIFEAIEP